MQLAIIAITPGGAVLARRLAAEAEGAELWLPEKLRGAVPARYFSGRLGDLLAELFARVDGLVCIMATGIVVRLLAPHLRDKGRDPAVVVVDEAGQFAVSLLSGHLGGANELAAEVAEILGGQAVITTATDVNGLPAWDEVARRLDMAVEPLARVKLLNGLLLRGGRIALVDPQGAVSAAFAGVPGVETAESFAAALDCGAEGLVFVTSRHLPQLERQPNLLALRPRCYAVGVGCNRGTEADEIEAVIRSEMEKAYLAPASIFCLASIDAKRDEGGLLSAAARFGVSLTFFSKEQLNAVEAPSETSEHALKAVGAGGVCEPAAILAAGGGRLLVKKKKSGNVTVAVAEIAR
ncbi:cobalt-precorrin 5A hydrolase [Geothermobacter ehrlichii]|nr:cobalt-precorrin 5A hydrolase [Geothermobacter ehrlichii]